MKPFIGCLCPTYRRPKLLAQSIEMFRAQDYPAERCELVIIDDSNERPERINRLENLTAGNVMHWQYRRRADSLSAKYNHLAWLCRHRADVLCVWEDDDEYRPWHLSAHAAALEHGDFSKPSRVLSDYPGEIVTEDAAGRFHASMAFTRRLYDRVGGWPENDRADFDQQMIARLTAFGSLVDPCEFYAPSYCFKWHTGHYHGQSAMRSPDDESWYRRVAESQ